MHPEARQFCQQWGHRRPGHALDVGGREINGNVREYWPLMRWTIIDLAYHPGPVPEHIDRVAEVAPGQLTQDGWPYPDEPGVRYLVTDAGTWMPDRLYDLVVSTELLEHTANWQECVFTMGQALRPGGIAVITCAGPNRQPHPMDGQAMQPGEHYGNIEPEDLRAVLYNSGFAIARVETDPHRVDVAALAMLHPRDQDPRPAPLINPPSIRDPF